MANKTDKVISFSLKVKYLILFAAIATGIAGALIAIFAYNTFGATKTLGIGVIADRNKLSPEEISTLTAKVSEILVLPEEEVPSVLTITDLTQLKGNPFFVNAQVRDKVLIYKKAGKIIIYNPDKNRIVNMGPYNAEADKPVSSPALQKPNASPGGQLPTPSPEAEATSEAGTIPNTTN